jgi:CheY-like chemotaxis protein
MKILVADDNEDAQVVLATLLKELGHETMLAPNGVVALETMSKCLPDMVITDILMPEMDGFELCRQIQANPQLNSTSVIIYTGSYVSQVDQELGLSLGAIKYITKPQEPSVLIELIEKVLQDCKK